MKVGLVKKEVEIGSKKKVWKWVKVTKVYYYFCCVPFSLLKIKYKDYALLYDGEIGEGR